MHSRTLKLVIERGFRSEGHTDTLAKGPAQTRTTCGQLSPGLTEPTGWSGQGAASGFKLEFSIQQVSVLANCSGFLSPVFPFVQWGVCVCVCVDTSVSFLGWFGGSHRQFWSDTQREPTPSRCSANVG